MNNLRRAAWYALPLALLMLTVGCPTVRTSNQGGGSIITVGQKMAEGNVGDLTADEWQIAADNLPMIAEFAGIDLTGVTLPSLTDEQAQAIVDLLDENGIQSFDDFATLGEIEIPAELQTLLNLFV